LKQAFIQSRKLSGNRAVKVARRFSVHLAGKQHDGIAVKDITAELKSENALLVP
jgi:hypothetical protein